MTSLLRDLFGVAKPVIAMLHLPGLPGRPRHDRQAGMRPVIETVARDVAALQDAGADGLLFCNEADLPYQIGVGPEAVAAMAAVIGAVRREISRPFGVNLVWDPVASLAIARATGASFVREVFTGAYAGDFGVWNTDPARSLEYRRRIGANDVKLFFNVTAEFAAPLAPRSIGLTARSAVFSSLADAVCISGVVTGSGVAVADLAAAKDAVAGAVPVIANTGVSPDTVAEILSVADGCIVGTALKRDGNTWNEVDPDRVARLVAAAAESGEWEPRPAQVTA
jgi:membrane complex biogenesis BtpA family protein